MARISSLLSLIASRTSLLALLCLFISSVNAKNAETILTQSWPPYILAQGETQGSAAKWLELLLDHQKISSQWQYLPYDMSFYYVSQAEQTVAFPFFKTAERAELVIYSDPVFFVTSKVYYNRQYLTEKTAAAAFEKKQKIGKVAGYSYGETLDKALKQAETFASEKQALTALFNHDINLLPMTEGVMNYHLTHNFPLRKELIKPLINITDTSSLHVIAANNEAGIKIIDEVDTAIEALTSAGINDLQTSKTDIPAPIDVAQLITTEGYPLITGQTEVSGDNISYYALPQGSKVVVIQWSEKMIKPSHSDRIYKNMMDLSKVVLLNGPHVGKELFVRNMHIELL